MGPYDLVEEDYRLHKLRLATWELPDADGQLIFEMPESNVACFVCFPCFNLCFRSLQDAGFLQAQIRFKK